MIAKLTLLSSVFVLMAQEAVPDGAIDPLARLGAISVLGAVVLGLVFRTLPKMAESWRDESNMWRTTIVGIEHQRHADDLELHRQLERLATALKSLEIHCNRSECKE